MGRTPQQQADDFVAANNKYGVIAGTAIELNASKPSKGCLYKLTDGRWYRLGVKALQLLPEEYPKWDFS